MSTNVTLEQEAAHLLQLYGKDPVQILGRIDSQLSVLAARAQTLLSLAGITITVTGFSGANIARSGRMATLLLVGGLVMVLVAAALTLGGILHVRWTTQMAPCSLEQAVHNALVRRNEKTRAYSRALSLLVLGLALYVGSVASLLLHNLPD